MQTALIIISFLYLLAGPHLFLFYGIVLLFGFVNSCCINNSMFHSGATGKDPKKNLALHEILMSIGRITGTAGGGFIYQRYRLTGTYLVLILILCLGFGAFKLLDRRNK